MQSSGKPGSNAKVPKNFTPAQRCKCMTSELTSEPSLKDPRACSQDSISHKPLEACKWGGGGSLCVSFLVGLAADCFLWVQYRLPKEQAVTGNAPPAQLGVCFILFVLLSTASPVLPQPEILLTSSSLVYFFKKKKLNVQEVFILLYHTAHTGHKNSATLTRTCGLQRHDEADSGPTNPHAGHGKVITNS